MNDNSKFPALGTQNFPKVATANSGNRYVDYSLFQLDKYATIRIYPI